MFNPFSKKKTEEIMVKEERNWSEKQNILAGNTPSQQHEDADWNQRQNDRADFLQWQQDLTPEVRLFIHKLKREIKDKDGNWSSVKGMKPLCNDMFVFDVVGLVEIYTSKNLINSNYTEDRVLSSMKNICYDFRCLLQSNRELYDINKYHMNLIIRMFKGAIEPTFFRSMNNGERRYAGDINKRVEIHTDQAELKKKGLFGIGT